jgi:hypothetical protein
MASLAGVLVLPHAARRPAPSHDLDQSPTPSSISSRPTPPWTGVDEAVAQQHLADAVTGRHQIAAQILPGADQIAQRLKLQRWDRDRAQLAGGVQARELERITRIGLDAITGLTRNRAR